MNVLTIEETEQTPGIDLNGDTGIFSITGKSYPENVLIYYDPVFVFLQKYKLQPRPKTILEFSWLYYNTATSKIIIKILLELRELPGELEVNWKCREEFDLMAEKGQEIAEVLDMKFNIILI